MKAVIELKSLQGKSERLNKLAKWYCTITHHIINRNIFIIPRSAWRKAAAGWRPSTLDLFGRPVRIHRIVDEPCWWYSWPTELLLAFCGRFLDRSLGSCPRKCPSRSFYPISTCVSPVGSGVHRLLPAFAADVFQWITANVWCTPLCRPSKKIVGHAIRPTATNAVAWTPRNAAVCKRTQECVALFIWGQWRRQRDRGWRGRGFECCRNLRSARRVRWVRPWDRAMASFWACFEAVGAAWRNFENSYLYITHIPTIFPWKNTQNLTKMHISPKCLACSKRNFYNSTY